MKQNCWDYTDCGRGPKPTSPDGLCPAAVEVRLNGAHGGLNAGRSCWVVAGTMCGGERQGSFARKLDGCAECGFYQQVRSDEFPKFKLAPSLLRMLHEEPAPAAEPSA